MFEDIFARVKRALERELGETDMLRKFKENIRSCTHLPLQVLSSEYTNKLLFNASLLLILPEYTFY